MFKIVIEHRTKDRECAKTLIKEIRKVRPIAARQPGFVSSNTYVDAADLCHVVIISTWQTRENWKAWDESPERAATRPQLEPLLATPFNSIVLPAPVIFRDEPGTGDNK
jgi:heme oxygenase (mycobilin-producing)